MGAQNIMSASYKRCDSFNPIQIKDGWIVRIGKDGNIRERIEKYLSSVFPNYSNSNKSKKLPMMLANV